MKLFKLGLVLFILIMACFSVVKAKNPLQPKAAIQGLVNMGEITFYNNPKFTPQNNLSELTNFQGIFQGTVINVTWAQLQPVQTGQLATGAIDTALAQIRTYNKSNPDKPIGAKLRVWGGFTAPAWAKSLNGGPITINATKHGGAVSQHGTIGLWWLPDYLAAWQNFQNQLAAQYDNEPLIQEVSVTSCASATDEPFISWSDTDTVNQLVNNYGYTDNAQRSCLSNALQHYSAWNNTLLDFPFSPFFPLQSNSFYPSPDTEFTEGVMDACVAQGKCILSNQGLTQTLNKNLLNIYTYMNTLYQNALAAGKPTPMIDFQTVSPLLIKNSWCETLTTGKNYHAQSVELWPSTPTFPGFTSLTAPELVNLAYLIENNNAYNPALCPPQNKFIKIGDEPY